MSNEENGVVEADAPKSEASERDPTEQPAPSAAEDEKESAAEDEKEGEGAAGTGDPAPEPEIPVERIDTDALWVVRRLRAKGHEAYLTGGCVRDLLLGRKPKDFDVATAAHPDEVKKVFRNCRLIGRRFRLAHVTFPGGKVIETATFRANPLDVAEDMPEDLLVERDNVFGDVEEDARRRDLTINGLFYDPIDGKVLDFVNGRTDLEKRLIRTIGDPDIRFQEDPVRIIRAIKFATRLEFNIEEETWNAMKKHVGELVRCAPARLQEELQRLLLSGHARRAFQLCEDVGVLEALMPELLQCLDDDSLEVPAPAAEGADHAESEPAAEDDGEAKRDPEQNGEARAPKAVPAKRAPAPLPTPAERRERYHKILESLDAVSAREVEVSSAVGYAALLLPAWEAIRRSTQDEEEWLEQLGATWTERLRMTRRDRETVQRLLGALDDLTYRRHGSLARGLVGRPWFREALLVFTISLHAAGGKLDDVAAWKAVAKHYDKPWRQPKKGERQPRPRRARRRTSGGGRQRSRRRRGS